MTGIQKITVNQKYTHVLYIWKKKKIKQEDIVYQSINTLLLGPYHFFNPGGSPSIDAIDRGWFVGLVVDLRSLSRVRSLIVKQPTSSLYLLSRCNIEEVGVQPWGFTRFLGIIQRLICLQEHERRSSQVSTWSEVSMHRYTSQVWSGTHSLDPEVGDEGSGQPRDSDWAL